MISSIEGWSHWTKEGTFKITRTTMAKSLFYKFFFMDVDLGLYCTHLKAAESISEGKHDQQLGFKASSLGVPSDPDKWNGFR